MYLTKLKCLGLSAACLAAGIVTFKLGLLVLSFNMLALGIFWVIWGMREDVL